MTKSVDGIVRDVIDGGERARWRLLDVVQGVQARLAHVPAEAIDEIAEQMGLPRVEVQTVVEFYSFLSGDRQGKVVIRLCDDILDRFVGYEEVKKAFENELGIKMGETTSDGAITLEKTACIGMCDQAPAALINGVVMNWLSSDDARRVVRELRSHGDPKRLVHRVGSGNNAHKLVQSMVENNIRLEGDVLFSPINRGEAIRKALAVSPMEVIRTVKASRLRGRGGAGFPTGMKWEFARKADGDEKVIICNADEGEPGTFKDRVMLTEFPDRVFAGMTIAGYAVGAQEGILYLRGEYTYLVPFLLDVLERRRTEGLLGPDLLGLGRHGFDIRIQVGAGAYVCGEETALISSCEGLAGEPKNRPPFPVQSGYLGRPTVVNNVETLACITKILEEGAASFRTHGTDQSSGTKLLSIAGDCSRPGIYEVPFGITLGEVLDLCGGTDAQAVQVGGPSGQMVGPDAYERVICYDDLATGGAIMVFGQGRDLLEVIEAFMEFFADESCGYCAPCRIGTQLMKERIERIRAGQGEKRDIDELRELCETVRLTSRCGLGQTAPNPILTSLTNFGQIYQEPMQAVVPGQRRSFDLAGAVRNSEQIMGRESVHTGGEK